MLVVAVMVALGVLGLEIKSVRKQTERLANELAECSKPIPTPAPCCKADECQKQLAQVDARFGGVWDELAQLHEDLAKLNPCGCGPVKECACDPAKPCACSDKPACECKPDANLPKRLILKRCK